MKVAPAEAGQGQHPDTMLVRAETCVFLIKLPRSVLWTQSWTQSWIHNPHPSDNGEEVYCACRYSSCEVMRERLLLSLSCALDPLSG